MKYPEEAMAHIQESFKIKPSSIEEPKSYLGADINKMYYSDGSFGWTMGAGTYVTHATKNLKKWMATEGLEYNNKLSYLNYSLQTSFLNLYYFPEMYVTDECSDSQIQLFHNLIVILQCTVELGQIDIAYEISVLSRYLAQPRTVHLVQVLHIFKYLDQHMNNDLAFDPAYHNFEDPALFQARIKSMK